jgi:hypothetical protein
VLDDRVVVATRAGDEVEKAGFELALDDRNGALTIARGLVTVHSLLVCCPCTLSLSTLGDPNMVRHSDAAPNEAASDASVP